MSTIPKFPTGMSNMQAQKPRQQVRRRSELEGTDFAWVVRQLPGQCLFAKVWGSHSHNTAMPTSDIDYLAVYVADLRQLNGLQPPPETVNKTAPDLEAHEVGKFCQLLLKGNPSMLETLFTETGLWFPLWDELRVKRMDFLSQQALAAYIGYATAQLARFDAGNRLNAKRGEVGEKWAYHMLRVSLDAHRISLGQAPVVWKDGEERDLLMAVREGRMSFEEAIKMAKGLITEAKQQATWVLPERGDVAWLNSWLLRVRGL